MVILPKAQFSHYLLAEAPGSLHVPASPLASRVKHTFDTHSAPRSRPATTIPFMAGSHRPLLLSEDLTSWVRPSTAKSVLMGHHITLDDSLRQTRSSILSD